MRQDQIERLKELSEQLADSFLLEANSRDWPGYGRAPACWTQQERGDAYWCKKNAMATGGVLRFTLDLIGKTAAPGADKPEDAAKESDLDRQIREAERRATEAVNRVVSKAKKSEFDKRVHGS